MKRHMVYRWVCLLLLTFGIGAAPVFAQAEIAPYASEADLGALIGQSVTVDGVFHRYAFAAPSIAISGRVFYLLENPPSKHTFDFPNESRMAVVTGTLYLYDGSIQYVEDYQRLGNRYYFFNIDEARVQFKDPLKASSGANGSNPMTPFFGTWRMDAESMEAEVFRIEDELTQSLVAGFIEAAKSFEMKISEDTIETIIPTKNRIVKEPYLVLSAADGSASLQVENEIVGTFRIDLSLASDRSLKMSFKDQGSMEEIPFSLIYRRW